MAHLRRLPAVFAPLATAAVAVLVSLGLAATRAQAQTPVSAVPSDAEREGRLTAVAALHDNDGLPNAGNTFRDDNYSAGMALSLSGRVVRDLRLTAPLDGLDRLTRVSRRRDAPGASTAHTVTLVGAAYTPNDLVTPAPQPDDRPFASLIGLTVRRTIVAADREQTWTSDLTVGALGLSAAQDIQTLLHRTRRWMTGSPAPPDPRGWPNQIANGGEPTARYRVRYDRRVAGARASDGAKRWQVTGGVEGSLGFETNAAATLAVRAGWFSSEFWEAATGILSPALGRQPGAGRARWEAFVFGAARPRVVVYNALLQGQFRESVHTVRPRRVVGEWEGGVGLAAPLGGYHLLITIGLAQGRTTEWVGERATPSTWGTVGITVSRPGR